MADFSKREYHSRDDIIDYIQQNYTGLEKLRGVSVGIQGSVYSVVVTDRFDWNQTLRIDPKSIDAYHEKILREKAQTPVSEARVERMRKAAAMSKAQINRRRPQKEKDERGRDR